MPAFTLIILVNGSGLTSEQVLSGVTSRRRLLDSPQAFELRNAVAAGPGIALDNELDHGPVRHLQSPANKPRRTLSNPGLEPAQWNTVRTMVMMAFLSFIRLALCALTTAPRSMLETVSADTSTKSALMMSFWSISRSASPADRQLVLTTSDTCGADGLSRL